MKRNTKQRRAILDVLSEHDYHPTTEEIFIKVKETVPGIGIATVYRNLEMLHSNGLINRIDLAGGPARYEGKTDPHHHAFCVHCGKISDVELENHQHQSFSGSNGLSGFTVQGMRVDFTGVCDQCALSA